ncbi:hypothetical protein PoMZ_09178 [Pyricularia oryzae]|uniref:Uncharacterized protein n=1 Tax=Pyricularia oryzae TaxID=318829 RepID=A0A4P7MZ15_PYROR|nr:hypothetical protein PoMZ_09178 [Pyricularia oryzae]
MPSVNFRRVKTGCTVLQAIYQAVQLRLTTKRIKQNWESAPALAVFISAAIRILSLFNDAQV